MDPVLLKTAVLPVILFLNTITWTRSAPLNKQPRMSLADWANYNSFQPKGAGTYLFGYDVEDPETNNIQYRDEERHPNGTVTGSYGYLRPDGNVHIARYVADENGYRVSIETHPRGQLKPYGNPDPLMNQASSISPDSVSGSSIGTEQDYKKQRIHEQRTRPIDKVSELSSSRRPGGASYHTVNENHKFSSYSNDFYEPSDFKNTFTTSDNNYEKPYRYFVK